MPYDAVIRLEELDASWARVGELTGITDLQEQFYCRNSTGARTRIAEYYTPALLDQVATIYARDYADLHYDRPTLPA